MKSPPGSLAFAREIVLTVDAGFCHCRATRSLSAIQRRAARAAAALGWLRLLPARGRFPRRYAVTSSGSHAIRTFAMTSRADLHIRRAS